MQYAVCSVHSRLHEHGGIVYCMSLLTLCQCLTYIYFINFINCIVIQYPFIYCFPKNLEPAIKVFLSYIAWNVCKSAIFRRILNNKVCRGNTNDMNDSKLDILRR